MMVAITPLYTTESGSIDTVHDRDPSLFADCTHTRMSAMRVWSLSVCIGPQPRLMYSMIHCIMNRRPMRHAPTSISRTRDGSSQRNCAISMSVGRIRVLAPIGLRTRPPSDGRPPCAQHCILVDGHSALQAPLGLGGPGCEATDTQLPYDPRDTGHRSSPTALFCCTAALFVHRHSIVRRSPHSALPMAPISCTDTAWASSLSCPHLIPLKCGTPPSSLNPCHTSQAFPAVPTPPRYPALIFVS